MTVPNVGKDETFLNSFQYCIDYYDSALSTGLISCLLFTSETLLT